MMYWVGMVHSASQYPTSLCIGYVRHKLHSAAVHRPSTLAASEKHSQASHTVAQVVFVLVFDVLFRKEVYQHMQ